MSIHLNICIQYITHTFVWIEHRNKLQIHSKHFSSLGTHAHCILLLPKPRQNECIHSSASSRFPPLFHHNHTFDEHYISQLLTEQRVATHCVQITTDLHCSVYAADILKTSLKRLGILSIAQVWTGYLLYKKEPWERKRSLMTFMLHRERQKEL